MIGENNGSTNNKGYGGSEHRTFTNTIATSPDTLPPDNYNLKVIRMSTGVDDQTHVSYPPHKS